MQKKLIALAVAAAVAAPLAANADVTIYGVMDVSYNIVDNDENDTKIDTDGVTIDNPFEGSIQDISSNSSRIGFKGSEDLGGGLKAIWQAETEIDVDSTTEPFNRNTFVGLAGDWGQVRVGRHDTPFKIVGRKADLFESEQLGENRILVSPSNGSIGWDARVSETVAYISPTFSGFHAAIAYVPEQEVDNGDAWSLAGIYDNGPLMLGVGYERHNEGIAGKSTTSTETLDEAIVGDVNGDMDATDTFPLTSTSSTGFTEDESAWRLVGSYSFGDFKVAGLYQSVKDDGGVKDADFDVWGLGGQYDFGNNAIKLSYYDRDEYDNKKDTGASMWSLGFDHNFTKRTKIYANYASVDNDSEASYSINSGGFDSGDNRSTASTVKKGGDSSGFAIGIRHKF